MVSVKAEQAQWRDVERIGIVARSDPKEHALGFYWRFVQASATVLFGGSYERPPAYDVISAPEGAQLSATRRITGSLPLNCSGRCGLSSSGRTGRSCQGTSATRRAQKERSLQRASWAWMTRWPRRYALRAAATWSA